MCINRRKTMSEMFRWNTKSVAYLSYLTRTLWKLEPRRKMLKAFEVDIGTMKATHPTLHHGLSFTFLPIFFSIYFCCQSFTNILTKCSSSTSGCVRHCHHKADRNSELPKPPGGREGFEVTAGGDGFLMFFCVCVNQAPSIFDTTLSSTTKTLF